MLIIFIIIVLIALFFILKKKKQKKSPPPQQLKKEENKVLDLGFSESATGFKHFLVFDTETTGLPIERDGDPNDISNWPRVIQLSWIILDSDFDLVKTENHFINPQELIPDDAIKIHGITNEYIQENGKSYEEVLELFLEDLETTQILVAHNLDFDVPIIDAELLRLGKKRRLHRKRKLCTQRYGIGYSQIFGERRKFPSLPFLCTLKYGGRESDFVSHNAMQDVILTAKIFQGIVECDVIKEQWIRPK